MTIWFARVSQNFDPMYIIDLNYVVEVMLSSHTFTAVATSRHELFFTSAQCTVVIYGTGWQLWCLYKIIDTEGC